jgi:hypothetical protein
MKTWATAFIAALVPVECSLPVPSHFRAMRLWAGADEREDRHVVWLNLPCRYT